MEPSKKPGPLPGPGIVMVPAVDWMWTKSVTALLNLELPSGSGLHFACGNAGPAEKRNSAIKALLADPHMGWIFFLDADMTPEPKTLLKLLSLDAPIAGALYYGRVPPFAADMAPLHGQKTADTTSGPFEVEWIGGGALLVRREVFERSFPSGPYFEYHHGLTVGEDVNFCKQARDAGFKILADPDIQIGHVGAIPVDKKLAISQQGEVAFCDS